MESLPLPSPRLQSVGLDQASQADVLVVALAEPAAGQSIELGGVLTQLNGESNSQGSGGWIERLTAASELRGKPGERVQLASPLAQGPAVIMVMGIGPEEAKSESLAFETAAAAVRQLIDRQRDRITIALGESFPPSMHAAIVAGALFACEGQGIYHSDPTVHVPTTLEFCGIDAENLRQGQVVGESLNRTRRLVNEPPSALYPESFARQAEKWGGEAGLQVEVWDEKRLEAEGCRAMLAVGRGSTKPPRLVVLRHQGGGTEPPIALVGKGVTFDSGGLSLKPSESMADMKCDMAGAATVLGVMLAIGQLGVPRNVIGYCGLAENMVSGDSYKLGDVIETRSGKTIEILNTDAEGRVVLADTLDVAVSTNRPAAIVDLATLTGACMVALGVDVCGLMSNDQSLCDAISKAAGEAGEPVWQLPMFELYDEKIKSRVADIKNIGEGRWGGAITAAKFLEQFVDDVPWVHIDIAGPAFADSAKPHRDAGATGVMVRSLLRWLRTG